MKILVVHPTGNENVKGVLYGLAAQQMLQHYVTTVACFPNTLFYSIAKGPLKEFKRRTYDVSIKPFTHLFPFMELGRIAAPKLKKHHWVKHETGKFSVDAIYHSIAQKSISFLKNDTDAVYAYEDGALEIFEAAKAQKVKCMYDLPIGYWRAMHRILKEEAVKRPEWACTITGFNDSPQKLNRKDQELKLADEIVVASSFTKETLKDYPEALAEIKVIPYGFPENNVCKKYVDASNRKINLLFAGSLSQRKGIANLIEAVAKLEDKVNLTIVGRKVTEDCQPLNAALAKYHWIESIAHDQLLALMKVQDLFVFPSLFEGFGLVITESMSQGTPVITTTHTCGADLINHGKNGWLVEAGSTESLYNQLIEIINNPDQIEIVGNKAWQTSQQRSWTDYGNEMAEYLKSK